MCAEGWAEVVNNSLVAGREWDIMRFNFWQFRFSLNLVLPLNLIQNISLTPPILDSELLF